MNKEVLCALADRWEEDAAMPECSDGSQEAKIPNAISDGIRQGKKECADSLRILIDMLG